MYNINSRLVKLHYVKYKNSRQYTMILLMGMCTNFTVYPIKPITTTPTPTFLTILTNSTD